MSREIAIQCELKHPLAILRVGGFLAQLEVYKLKNQAEAALRDGIRYILLDLTLTDFIDSAGIGAIVSLRIDCNKAGGKLLIVEPRQQTINHTLTNSSIPRLVPCFADMQTALANMQELYGIPGGHAPHPDVAAAGQSPAAGNGLEALNLRLEKIENALQRIEQHLLKA
jgi:anti-anti-sigma factor